MAKMTAKEVRDAIETLSDDEREILYLDIIDRINSVEPEIEAAWSNVAKRRLAEIKSGKVETIPADQVLAEARAMLNEKRKSRISSAGES